MQILYTYFAYPLLHFGFLIASLFNKKIREGFRLRKIPYDGQKFSKDEWVWFHVASGELEYAKPVMRLLKANPQFKAKILVTYFSPSILGALKKTSEIDYFLPMPWDTPWHWQKFIKTFKPRALAISRTDTWPNMVWEAHKAQIPSLLFSATLPKESGRVASFWGRLFYQSIFKDLTKISVVSEEDKENFRHISESLDVFVEGDTRFDQVISRVEEKRTLPEWCNKLNGPAFVAGSTWPEDERHLFVAIAALSRSIGFTTIVAPHEPTPEHLKNIENKLVALGLKSQRFSEVGENPSAPVLIVDSVGILADLYRLGQVAFVGGSFKKTVHSVMEPAASGCLTLFGPYYRNNREAIALRNAKLAYEVAGAADLEKRLQEHFQKTNEEKESLRKSVLRFVQGNKGVSQKIAQWVIEKSFQSG